MKILDKIAYVRQLHSCWKQDIGYKPLRVYLCVTSRCNLHCVMCNIWRLAKEKPGIVDNELSTQDWTNLFDELSYMGTEMISISGGEPTSREDIAYLIRYAKDKNLNVTLITNGTLITQTKANELVRSGLDIIDFSIDGPTAVVHDKIRGLDTAWDSAMRGIELISLAKQASGLQKPSIQISYTVSRMNYQFIEQMVDLKSKLNYDALHFGRIIGKVNEADRLFLRDEDISNLEAHLPILRDKFQNNELPLSPLSALGEMCSDREGTKRGRYLETINRKVLCFTPWQMAVIDPFGNVYPCGDACSFLNISRDLIHGLWETDDYNMGNIKRNSFSQIWNNDKYKQFRNRLKDFPSFPFCDWCVVRSINEATLTGLFKDRRLLIKIIHSRMRRRFRKSESLPWEFLND